MKDQINDITPTYLTGSVCSAIRQADFVVNEVFERLLRVSFALSRARVYNSICFLCVQFLASSSSLQKITQIPVVLLPLHFDRDVAMRIPSCQRSVVIRPFISNDFMTGLPALPGKDLPLDVSIGNGGRVRTIIARIDRGSNDERFFCFYRS